MKKGRLMFTLVGKVMHVSTKVSSKGNSYSVATVRVTSEGVFQNYAVDCFCDEGQLKKGESVEVAFNISAGRGVIKCDVSYLEKVSK
jgi:hypothetical protein